MAKTRLTKNGVTIYVNPGNMAAHQAMGWMPNPVAVINAGALSLDAVLVTVPAARLNELDLPPIAVGKLENLHLRHYQIAPVVAGAAVVHAALNLNVATQQILTGISNPDVPRVASITGGFSGQTGNVTLLGTNIQDENISDTIALSGTSTVNGTKAFKSIVEIDAPVETHAHTAQVNTATVVGTITGSGNVTVIVTAAGMTGSPKTISVAVLNGDSATVVAGKIITALAADTSVNAKFSVGGAGANVVLTALVAAANDATLNISTANGTCTGLTTEATSVNTTAGVPYDTVSVGEAAMVGLPHIVSYPAAMLLALFNGTADSGGSLAVDSTYIEKNLYTPAGTYNGTKLLDLYYMA